MFQFCPRFSVASSQTAEATDCSGSVMICLLKTSSSCLLGESFVVAVFEGESFSS